jgi:hypothetical protein
MSALTDEHHLGAEGNARFAAATAARFAAAKADY